MDLLSVNWLLILLNFYGCTLGIYEGTDLGSFEGSFDEYNSVRPEVSLICDSLVSDEVTLIGFTDGVSYWSKDGMFERSAFGVPFWSTDGIMLHSVEVIKFVSTDDELLSFTFGLSDGYTFGVDEGNDLGSFTEYFFGSHKGNPEFLLIG